MNYFIRQETVLDFSVTEQVVKSAFANMKISDKTEHILVSRLRKSEDFIPQLSLVALEGEEIVGHILVTKCKIKSTDSLAMAPVSVLPDYQNKGIGSLLVKEALRKATELGYTSVIVLGHPRYYPKFGFKKASEWGINAPWQVPDEVFMALELQKHALTNVSGVVEYSKAFFE